MTAKRSISRKENRDSILNAVTEAERSLKYFNDVLHHFANKTDAVRKDSEMVIKQFGKLAAHIRMRAKSGERLL